MTRDLFGKRLRQQRKNQKITLEQLASKIDVSPNFLGDLERGKRSPSFDCLLRIINALNVSADVLLIDSVEAAEEPLADEIANKLKTLTPIQRGVVMDIMETVVEGLQKTETISEN